MATSLTPPQNVKKYSIRTVVIDAGHGGHDTGCIGGNAKEKDVALAIALRLGAYIESNFTDVKVLYTRKTDVFVELNKRAEIANNNKADLFICVHCNDGPKTAFGTETWVMGLHKTEDNLNVAKRENASILMEYNYKSKYDGYDINSPESNIIFSLYQSAFMDQSLSLASRIQKSLKEQGGRSSRGVKQAGFLVLYKTAMPSILIETGFLTNPTEEKFMATAKGQDVIASSIFRAFKDYKADIEGSGGTASTSSNSSDLPPAQAPKQAAVAAPAPAAVPVAAPVSVPARQTKIVKTQTSSTVVQVQPVPTPTVAPPPAPAPTVTPTIANTRNNNSNPLVRQPAMPPASTPTYALNTPAATGRTNAPASTATVTPTPVTTPTTASGKKQKPLDPEAQARLADKAQFEQDRQNKLKLQAEGKVKSEAKERLQIEAQAEIEAKQEKIRQEAEAAALKQYEEEQKRKQIEHDAKVKTEIEKIKKDEAERRHRKEMGEQEALDIENKYGDEADAVKQREINRQKAIEQHENKVQSEMDRMRKSVKDSLTRVEADEKAFLEAETYARLTGGVMPKRKRPAPITAPKDTSAKKNRKVDKEALARAEDKAQFNAEKQRQQQEKQSKAAALAKAQQDARDADEVREEARKRLEDEAAKETRSNPARKEAKRSAKEVNASALKAKKEMLEDIQPEEEPAAQLIGGVPVIDKRGTFYTVQIASSYVPIRKDSLVFRPAGNNNVVVERNLDGLYKYMSGRTQVFNDAVLLQRNLREAGYKDAFMVAYDNGRKTGVQEARTIIANSQRNAAAQTPQVQAPVEEPPAEPENKSFADQGKRGRQPVIQANKPEVSLGSGAPGMYGEDFKTPEALPGVYYGIQLAVSEKPIPITAAIFLHTKREIYREVGTDHIYRYAVGPYRTLRQANAALSGIKLEGFKDAFIIAYQNNKRVPVDSDNKK